jgi:predicted MFS family arabinose efflux permease
MFDIPNSAPALTEPPTTASRRGLGATLVLGLGAFAVGTDAYVVAGFLPAMARSLGVSVGTAGQAATVFAISYAVLSPVLASLTAQIPKRSLLVGALGVLALANLGSALAPDYAVLMATRVVAAFGAAVYTPGAGAVAAALVAPARRARALAVVVGGLTVATALGVPLGNLVGSALGWRATLGLVAALCLACAVAVRFVMTPLPGSPAVPLRERLAALRRPGVLAVLPLTMVGMAAGYGLYAYAVPVLLALGGTKAEEPLLLFAYGLGAITGNLLSGAAGDRYGPIRVLASGYAVLTVTLAVCAWTAGMHAHWPTLAGVLMFAWGAGSWFQTPAQQLRLISAAPHETAVVVGLNASALYAGIGTGTALGGVLLAVGPPAALAACAGLAGISLGYLALTRRYR